MGKYRDDTPVDLSDESLDAFGHRDYATALVKLIDDVEKNFTIGLLGEWGAGKTGILREAKRQLQVADDKAAMVIVDAWRYEGDALRRELLSDVSGELVKADKLEERERNRLLEELQSDVTEEEPRGLPGLTGWRDFGVLLLQLTLGAVAIVFALWLIKKGLKLKDGTLEKAYPVLIAAALTYALNALAKGVRVEHVQVRTPKLEDPDRFAEKFRDLVQKANVKRLVIAVDNLDRCSPETVDEVLTTIKTFLEPASGDKQLLFVIAADDEALRRHLVAQELENADMEQDRDKAAGAARERVDEKLRKFFDDTGLRVTDLFDEEMQTFTRQELQEFADDEGIEGEELDDLVDMIVSALRRNPRRIKQFVNNLQTKLTLLRAREASKRIQPQVSNNVRLVAKLLIIEEQWPEQYRALRQDHRRLGDWHQDVRSPSYVSDTSPDEPDTAWDAFLRSTEHIEADQARAVIHLKMQEKELSLPQYAKFTDALDEGASHVVEEVLSGADDEQQGQAYAEVVSENFTQQLRRSPGEALNTVKVIADSSPLRELAPDEVRSVLTQALKHPTLARRLNSLSKSEGVIDAGLLLSDGEFSKLVQLLTLASSTENEQVPTNLDFAPALAPHADRLNDAAVGDLRQAIESSRDEKKGLGNFEDYFPLAERRPEVLPKALVEEAVQALQDDDVNVAVDSKEYRLGVVAVLAGADTALADKLFTATVRTIVQMAMQQGPEASEDEEPPVVMLAASALKWVATAELGEQAAQAGAEQLNTVVIGAAADIQPLLAQLIIQTAAKLPDGARDTLVAQLVENHFSEDPGQALDFYGSDHDLPDFVEVQLGAALSPYLSGSQGDADVRDRAIALALELPNAGAVLSKTATSAITDGYPEAASAVLQNGHTSMNEEQLDEVIEAALNAQTEEALMTVLVLEADQLSDDQRERLTAWVDDQLAANTDVSDFVRAALKKASWRSVVTDMVARLAERLISDAGSNLANLTVELELVGEGAEDFDQSRRHDVAMAVLSGVAAQPGLAAQTESPLAKLTAEADTEERKGYVDQIIASERGQGPDVATRQALLRLAQSLSGSNRTKASKQLTKRFEELRESEDPTDQQVAEAFSDD